MKLKRFGALVLTAALTLSLTILPARAAAFEDVAETDWFYENVEDLYEKGIIRGYEDGLFYPGRTMSTVEALLFCTRIAGVDAQIQNEIYQELGNAVKARIPESMSWAAPELSVAVELGILSLDELEDLNQIAPGSVNSSVGPTPYLGWNIPREQFCMYLVRAMQLEPLAQSLGVEFCTSYLSHYFMDTEEITPIYRPYIYVLYNYDKVLGGEPAEGGGFNAAPGRNLFRRETAAFISRAIAEMEKLGLYAEASEYTTYPWAAGTIQDSSSNSDGTILLTLSSPITGVKTYTLPSDVAVYDEYNMKGSHRDLANGSYARLILDEVSGEPYAVRLCGELTTLEGRVISYNDRGVTLWVEGASRSLDFSRFTQFKAGDATGDKSILEDEAGYSNALCYLDSKGTLVGAAFSGGTVQREGIISAVTVNTTGTTLTVADAAGVNTSYIIPDDARVLVNQAEGTALSANHVGRPVVLRVGESDNKVSSVSVDTMTLYLQGPITNQSGPSSGRVITFKNALDNDKAASATLAPSVVITYDGEERTSGQIDNGWFATAKVEGGMITELTAYSATYKVEGTLTDITYAAAVTTLHVSQSDGGVQDYTLDMTSLPEITRDGKTASPAQLRKGDSLTITLRYHAVEKVEAKAREADLTGEILEISQGQAGMKVKVRLSDNTEETYTVCSNVSVTKDGKALTYRDLSYGDKIAFIANGAELISVEIQATAALVGDTMLMGQVLSVDTRGNNRLMYLLVTGITDPVEVNLKNANSIQDLNGRSLSLISGGLKSGDTVTVFGERNGAVFEAKMVIKTGE